MTAPLIIVGMHRSGTTLLTRMLRAQGMFVGHRLSKHAEALLFHAANVEMLRAAGTEWDAPRPALAAMGDAEALEHLTAIARRRLSGPQTWRYLGPKMFAARGRIDEHLGFAWGFKDPRNAVLLPVWLRLFPTARVLHIRRHGIDVAASLAEREARRAIPGDCVRIEAGLALWSEYEAALDAALARVPAERQLTVRFEDHAAEPDTVQAAINAFAGLGPPVAPPSALRPDLSRCFAYRAEPALRATAERHAELLRAHGYAP